MNQSNDQKSETRSCCNHICSDNDISISITTTIGMKCEHLTDFLPRSYLLCFSRLPISSDISISITMTIGMKHCYLFLVEKFVFVLFKVTYKQWHLDQSRCYVRQFFLRQFILLYFDNCCSHVELNPSRRSQLLKVVEVLFFDLNCRRKSSRT